MLGLATVAQTGLSGLEPQAVQWGGIVTGLCYIKDYTSSLADYP